MRNHREDKTPAKRNGWEQKHEKIAGCTRPLYLTLPRYNSHSTSLFTHTRRQSGAAETTQQGEGSQRIINDALVKNTTVKSLPYHKFDDIPHLHRAVVIFTLSGSSFKIVTCVSSRAVFR